MHRTTPTDSYILSNWQILFWSVGLLLLGLLLTFFIVPILRNWAIQHGLVDRLDPLRKLHRSPTPRIGGVSMMIPFWVGTALIGGFLHRELVDAALAKEWLVMIAGCSAIFFLGLCDDIRPLGARVKLFFQLAICSLVALFGFQLHVLSNPFTGGQFDLGTWGWFFAAFWLLSTTNLINLIDGADGLAAGVSFIVFAALALTMWFTVGVTMFLICILMLGVLLGFLAHNFPPARIFMGDGGAYFLGFLIGQVGLAGDHKSTIAAAMVVPLLALGVPIIDTVLAILRRAIRGLPLFRADCEHVHHRLIELGLSPQKAVMLIYLVCVVFCAMGLVVFFQRGKGLALSLGIMFTLGLAAMWALRYFRNINPWWQIQQAMQHRNRTVKFATVCERWITSLRSKKAGGNFFEHFWHDLKEDGFDYFCCVFETGERVFLGTDLKQHEGGYLKIRLPVLNDKKEVAVLEFGIRDLQGADVSFWERHAVLAREVVTFWIQTNKGSDFSCKNNIKADDYPKS